MADSKVGVKETREAALGLVLVSKKLIGSYKKIQADGKVDLADLPALLELLMDAEFIATVQSAVDGIDQVGAEIADLQLVEGIELVKDVGLAVLDAVQSLKA